MGLTLFLLQRVCEQVPTSVLHWGRGKGGEGGKQYSSQNQRP